MTFECSSTKLQPTLSKLNRLPQWNDCCKIYSLSSVLWCAIYGLVSHRFTYDSQLYTDLWTGSLDFSSTFNQWIFDHVGLLNFPQLLNWTIRKVYSVRLPRRRRKWWRFPKLFLWLRLLFLTSRVRPLSNPFPPGSTGISTGTRDRQFRRLFIVLGLQTHYDGEVNRFRKNAVKRPKTFSRSWFLDTSTTFEQVLIDKKHPTHVGPGPQVPVTKLFPALHRLECHLEVNGKKVEE